MDDEVEIKIEYFESFESDPLLEAHGKKYLRENCDVQDEFENDEQDISITPKEMSKTDDTTYLVTETESTWYKGVDEMGKYKCKFCELSYLTIQSLRYHAKTKHQTEAKELREIIAKNRRRPKFKCHICKIHFVNLCKLKSHLHVSHKIEDSMCFCKHCKQEINSDRISDNVKGEQKKNKTFQCPLCPQLLSRKYSLKTHIKTRHKSHDQYEYNCPFCPYRAPLNYYIQTHIATNHPDTEYAKAQNTHFCDTCGYRTKRKSHFLKHKLLHASEDNRKTCAYCDYSTTNEGNLKVHIRIHTQEKPFICSLDGCEYRCSGKSALRSHQMTHNKDKFMLYCDKCSYTTLYKQSLNRHYAAHVRNNVI